MSTVLADSPPAPADADSPVAGADGEKPDSAPAPAGRKCAKCGAPMDRGQGWCMECGAAAPGSLATRAPGWRSTATILGATAILLIGAATAAYAALNKKESHPVTAVVVRPPATSAAPVTPSTTPALPQTAKIPATPSTAGHPLPKLPVAPPKIPLTAPTPKAAAKTTPATTPTSSTPTSSTPTSSTPPPVAPSQNAIVLDTNAVSTYNPNNYPASEFGEPSLTIDGETSTAWWATVRPETAPKMAVGLLVDMRAAQKLSSLQLISSTPGMTVQVFAANGSAAPATISDPAWVKLTKALVAKNRHESIKLGNSTKGFRFVVLWITKAPAASVGTPQAPGRVDVNEIELFPPK